MSVLLPKTSGVPAYDGLFELKQPSGKAFEARKHGDEWHNWVETKDGYGIYKNRLTGYKKVPRSHAKGNKHEAYANDSTWEITAIDAPKYVDNFSSRFIAVDTSGNPHIVYGGDHLYYAYYDGSAWQFETADASPSVGEYASIALDTSGKVHIIYYDYDYTNGYPKGYLKYATNASGSWVTNTVVSSEYVDEYASLALDSSDNAHISYHSGNGSNLMYATNVSGKWKSKRLEKGYTAKSSIVIDKSDKVHIGYYSSNGTNYNLNYITNTSGSWKKTKIEELEDEGGTSIAIDSSGNTHISYYDGSFFGNGDIKYATNSSGSWVITTIINEDADGSPSIAVDASDNVHISYNTGHFWIVEGEEYAPYIKYATNASGTWVTTTVDEGNNSSIGLDTAGKVHIGYYYSAIKYANNVSGSWNTTTVDDNIGAAGNSNSIAIDSSNKAHISYQENIDVLKYATNISGSWVISTVDSGRVGDATSLALDTSGKAHISYFDRGDAQATGEYDLKYATNASGNWVITTIDSSGQIDGGTSIAVDSSANVHIVYYNYNGYIKYATNVSGKWNVTTVDSIDSASGNPSIAIDKLGYAHISYGNGAIKYATNASGSWVTNTVDSKGYGYPYSIALDSSNNAHISYSNESKDYVLTYATNASGSWITTTVDSEVYVGSNSLALDSSDKVHISYHDISNQDLKYVTGVFTGVFLGMIYGTVTDTEGVPIESAKVKLKSKEGETTIVNKEVKTDEEGSYEFTNLEEGTYQLQVKKIGYKKSKKKISLDDGEKRNIDFILK